MTLPVKLPWWAALSLAAAAILSLYSLALRHKAEARNRAVGIAADITAVDELSAIKGISLVEALKQLKKSGLTAVALSEESVEDVISDRLLYGAEDGSNVDGRMERHLKAVFGDSDWSRIRESGGDIPIGINPTHAEAAREAGLQIIARHSGHQGATEESIRMTLEESKSLGADWLLPSGDSVPGSQKLLRHTADVLDELDMVYLSPEFVAMDGDGFMREHMKEQTVRLHAIQQVEVTRMARSAVIERLVKSVHERANRFVLVRPSTRTSEDPLGSFDMLIQQVRRGVREAGMEVRIPRPLTEPKIPAWLTFLIPLAAVPGLAWLGLAATSRRWLQVLWIGLCIGTALLAFKGESGRQLFVLLAATSTPIIAYAAFLNQKRAVNPWTCFLAMSAISIVGGLIVAGELTGLSYQLQNIAFRGVKAAHFLPIFIIGLFVLRSQVNLKQAANRPMVWGAAVFSAGVLGVLFFMLIRTGNDSGAVSSLELQFRSILDQLLPIRPRTKAFLIGHPALLTGLILFWKSAERPELKPWACVLIGAGAIGQTCMVNTLAHLHTPVILGLQRVGLGLLLGGIIGTVAGLAIIQLSKGFKSTLQPSEGT
jgi:hypothetical protein